MKTVRVPGKGCAMDIEPDDIEVSDTVTVIREIGLFWEGRNHG